VRHIRPAAFASRIASSGHIWIGHRPESHGYNFSNQTESLPRRPRGDGPVTGGGLAKPRRISSRFFGVLGDRKSGIVFGVRRGR
jgi:hypothetical protein